MQDTINIGFNVEKLFATFMGAAKVSLEANGVPDIIASMNDITSRGKKIMGAAATIKKKALLFHAARLVDTNLNTLSSVLKVPGIKLKDKGVSTILGRVANIKELSGLGIEQVKFAMLSGHSLSMGFEFERGEITSSERSILKRLYEEKYSKDIWNMGRELIEIK
jgi:lipoate-protein ligase A